MMQMNNPVMQMIAAMKNGRDPMHILQGMAQRDPQISQLMRMMQGKSSNELRQMAQNMAAERGTSVEDIARQLGISIPSNR